MKALNRGTLGAIALLWSSAAAAEEYVDVTLVNNSDKAIVQVHFSSPGLEDWASDRLLGATIAPGARGELVLDALDSCDWNMRVTFQDGTSEIQTDLQPCSDPVIVVD